MHLFLQSQRSWTEQMYVYHRANVAALSPTRHPTLKAFLSRGSKLRGRYGSSEPIWRRSLPQLLKGYMETLLFLHKLIALLSRHAGKHVHKQVQVSSCYTRSLSLIAASNDAKLCGWKTSLILNHYIAQRSPANDAIPAAPRRWPVAPLVEETAGPKILAAARTCDQQQTCEAFYTANTFRGCALGANFRSLPTLSEGNNFPSRSAVTASLDI